MSEDGIGEERYLNTSSLDRTFSNTMDKWGTENCRWNIELFVCFEDCSVDVTMQMTLDGERGDLRQIGDIVVDLVGRLTWRV